MSSPTPTPTPSAVEVSSSAISIDTWIAAADALGSIALAVLAIYVAWRVHNYQRKRDAADDEERALASRREFSAVFSSQVLPIAQAVREAEDNDEADAARGNIVTVTHLAEGYTDGRAELFVRWVDFINEAARLTEQELTTLYIALWSHNGDWVIGRGNPEDFDVAAEALKIRDGDVDSHAAPSPQSPNSD